ncbi:MAG: hypothetical protein LUC48_09975 [Clostridiales bacterium]|nr:hypothetical protein [Clostridiales bacterium]
MSDETVLELIKALAYGYTAAEVAEVEGLTAEEAEAFAEAHAEDVAAKAAELAEAGWL